MPTMKESSNMISERNLFVILNYIFGFFCYNNDYCLFSDPYQKNTFEFLKISSNVTTGLLDMIFGGRQNKL